jgi:ribonuclease P protein component
MGARRRVGGLIAFVAESGQSGPPRVAVVAGRRIGGAVVRNRAKRRMREALVGAPIRDGHDYVVVATSETVAEAPWEDLVGWMRRAVHEKE